MAAKRDAKGRYKKRTTRRKRRNPGTAVARRRRSRAAPARKRRRTYRRNPKFAPMKTLIAGAQGAVAATIGKAAARAIPQQVGLSTEGPMGIAAMAAVALAVGMVADQVAPRHAPFVVAGALMAPIETVIRDLNIPVLSPALSAYPGLPSLRSGTPALNSGRGSAGVAAYPSGAPDPFMIDMGY